MKRTLALTLTLLFAGSVVAQAQKRHATAKAKPSAAKSQSQGDQTTPPYQEGQVVQTTICKGLAIPEGYTISGETSDGSCANGAWVLKRKGTHTYVPATMTATESAARSVPQGDDEAARQKADTVNEIIEKRADEEARRVAISDAIRRHEVIVGMTKDQVLQSWGAPDAINTDETRHLYHEQWVYRGKDKGNVYFDNGVMTGLQRSY